MLEITKILLNGSHIKIRVSKYAISSVKITEEGQYIVSYITHIQGFDHDYITKESYEKILKEVR